MKTTNLFESIPQNLEQEVFEILAENEKVKIERIISKGHTSPDTGWYEQEQNEWIIVLRGEAIISFDGGEEKTLKVGDYLNIVAFTKHKVKWTDPNIETIWLAVHY